jgi:Condensation domain
MNHAYRHDNELVERLRTRQRSAGPPGIPPRAAGTAAPLSFGQQRMWLTEQLEPDAGLCNYGYAARIQGELDVGALDRAVAALVRRHEILRTVLAPRDGQLVQQVLPDDSVQLRHDDVSTSPDPVAEAYRRARKRCAEPYFLNELPAVRWELLRIGDQDHLLVWCAHHAVVDGWSESILNRDLSAFYQSFSVGVSPHLRPLQVQYADFSVWQRQQSAVDATFRRDLAYWRGQLADAPAALCFPFRAVPDEFTGYAGETVTQDLPADLVDDLRRVAKSEGTTLFVVLLSAFAVLLGRECDQDDLVVGVPVAGRSRPELEELIGFFVNTIGLRIGLAEAPSFRQLVAQVRETTLQGLSHQEIPFEEVVRKLGPERPAGRQPLVQVLFQLHNVPTAALELPGLRVRVDQLFHDSALLDLTLSFVAVGQTLRGYWNYRSELFDRQHIERLQEQLAELMRELASG